MPADAASRAGDALADDLGFLLARASAIAVSAANTALAPLGLRVRSYSALALVAGGARPSQRELAAVLRLDPSQIVALVDELERAGLVRRDADPFDRRTKVVVVTDEGRDTAARARELVRHSAGAALAPADRERLTSLLRDLAFADDSGG